MDAKHFDHEKKGVLRSFVAVSEQYLKLLDLTHHFY